MAVSSPCRTVIRAAPQRGVRVLRPLELTAMRRRARAIGKLPDYKPVSVPLRAAVIHLGLPLLTGSSDLPGSLTGRAVPPPLFGLAPRGVFPAGEITPAAVRSYRTISPLPHTLRHEAVYFLWHFPSSLAALPAVSRHVALWRPDFPPPFPEATAHPAASRPLSHFHSRCVWQYKVRLGTNPMKFLQISDISGVF